MSYYFFSFHETAHYAGITSKVFDNGLTDKHPLKLFLEIKEKTSTAILLSWQEISKEDYDKYLDAYS